MSITNPKKTEKYIAIAQVLSHGVCLTLISNSAGSEYSEPSLRALTLNV